MLWRDGLPSLVVKEKVLLRVWQVAGAHVPCRTLEGGLVAWPEVPSEPRQPEETIRNSAPKAKLTSTMVTFPLRGKKDGWEEVSRTESHPSRLSSVGTWEAWRIRRASQVGEDGPQTH